MATTKKKTKLVVKKTVKTAAAKPAAKAIKGKAQRTKVSERKKPAKSQTRGLVVFISMVAVVLALVITNLIKQGPPTKLLPMDVMMSFQAQEVQVGPVSSPHGVAVDKSGNVYVTDLGNHRIVKFSPEGKVATVWGKKGTAAGEFNEPSGIAMDNQGDIYVADTWNGRIQKFSEQGEYFGEITSKAGVFYSPRNVAVDPAGFIYVADTGNSCVKKFDTDANQVKRWGEYGTGKTRFQETFGLASDAGGLIYVGDAGNRRIKIYTSDGKWVREIKVKGWQTGVGWPMMVVDGHGTVYATDVQHNMVWIYNQQGKYVGSWGNKPGKEVFASPLGIAVGPDNDVYVSNMNRGDVVKIKGWIAGK